MLMKNIIGKILLSTATVVLLAGLSGCEDDDTHVHAVEQGYSANKSGVITAETLTAYIDDWSAARPASATGRLVIIQAGATTSGKFIKQDEANGVYVYEIPTGGACDPSYMRHDGVSYIPGALLTGQYTDGMINAFHLDPENDYVVFAVGEGSTGIREIIRSWWVLVYWGWNDERLAFLNGSVSYDFSASSGLSDYLVDTASAPPATPSTYSVKTLATDRTELQIYLKEMMDIASKDDKTGFFIADARGSDEYNGVKKSKTADKNCGPAHDEQCYSPYQGHIRDAVDFPYTDILVMDDQVEDITGDGSITEADASFKFRSPLELKSLYAAKGYQDGDKVIAYCRTGRKATLLTLTSYAVLKYPVAMYDGSWIQWGEMAHREDVNGTMILPTDSEWITDSTIYSVNLGYTDANMTQSSAPYDINNTAIESNKVVLEDKAYLGL
jgi:3-mercaptopyruvate sulfurtransferase SseA